MLELAAALAIAAQTPASVGDCTWRAAPEQVRSGFLSAYRTGIHQGTAFLASQDAVLSAAAARCQGGRTSPRTLIQGDIESTALQAGAAAELLAARGLSRSQLDALWLSAPAAARDCYRGNAARPFGIPGPACPDVKATFWFFDKTHVSPVSDRATASQVIIFYNAKAQQEWAEGLLSKPAAGG